MVKTENTTQCPKLIMTQRSNGKEWQLQSQVVKACLERDDTYCGRIAHGSLPICIPWPEKAQKMDKPQSLGIWRKEVNLGLVSGNLPRTPRRKYNKQMLLELSLAQDSDELECIIFPLCHVPSLAESFSLGPADCLLQMCLASSPLSGYSGSLVTLSSGALDSCLCPQPVTTNIKLPAS